MKKLEYLFYTIIGFMAFVKCFAISKVDLQVEGSYVITALSLGCIIHNWHLFRYEIPKTIIIYLFTLILSALHIGYNVTFDNYLDSLLFPLLFIVSYIFFKKNPQFYKYIKFIGVIGIILAYFNLIRLSTEANMFTSKLMQSNAGNTLVALLPFVFLWKNKYIRYALIALVFYGCLISLKRSAFIIFIAVLFSYYLLGKRGYIKSKLVIYTSLFILTFLFVLPYIEMAQPLLERLSEASEDGGSGRDVLTLRCIEYQGQNGFVEWLVGNGYKGFSLTSLRYGYYNTCAHNDLVEILYDAGIVAYIVYLLILYKLIALVKKMYASTSEHVVVFTACLVVFIFANIFVCTFVHFWYYLPMYLLFGATLAMYESNYTE